jgi:hypothetical protein
LADEAERIERVEIGWLDVATVDFEVGERIEREQNHPAIVGDLELDLRRSLGPCDIEADTTTGFELDRCVDTTPDLDLFDVHRSLGRCCEQQGRKPDSWVVKGATERRRAVGTPSRRRLANSELQVMWCLHRCNGSQCLLDDGRMEQVGRKNSGDRQDGEGAQRRLDHHRTDR